MSTREEFQWHKMLYSKMFNRMMRSHIVFFLGAVILLWLNFTNHSFSSLSLEKFLEGEFRSEGYAISRLIYNLDHGHDAKGGFMLMYKNIDMLEKSTHKEDFKRFKEANDDKNIKLY